MSGLREFLPPLSTTGIGSLPFVDPRLGARHAVRAYNVPFCPQLPALDGDMVGEWLGTQRSRCGWTDDMRRGQPAGWDAFLQALDQRLAAGAEGARVVKLQVTGPVTLAVALERACGRNDGAADRAALAGSVARWLAATIDGQVAALRARGWRALVVVDEPGLAAAQLSASRPEHAAIWDPLRDTQALAWGMHVCGSVPWDIVRAVAPGVVSFDAVRYGVDREARTALRALIQRGAHVAWGVVDPCDPGDAASIATLVEDCLMAVACNGDTEAVAAQSLLTPSCGTGRLSVTREHLVAALLGAAAASLPLGPGARNPAPPHAAWLASAAMALDRSSTIDDLSAFYEEGYSIGGEEGAQAGAWRELGARVKARNILELAAPTGDGWRCLDVGCGDGVVLSHLAAAQPGWKLAGVEIADAPVALAQERLPAAEIRSFDGATLGWPDQSFDLAYATHVIEHVPEPVPLLREMARVAARVVIEVPLEDNRSARRPSRRAIAEEVGHVQRLSRESMRTLMAEAGLTVTADHSDPLERAAHTFYADGLRAKLIANAKWASRAGLHALAPPLAQRLFTVHYACIGVRARS